MTKKVQDTMIKSVANNKMVKTQSCFFLAI